ncbi:hypothetical protein DV735_g1419, partial [Chaetothyriales sp. CBS 134920]
MSRPWDSKPSLSANSYPPSASSLALASSATSDQRSDSRSSHDYGIDTSSMDEGQWCSLALALGLNPCDEEVPNLKASKLASKIKKASSSEKEMVEMLTTLLLAIVAPYPRMLIARNSSFHREAVPAEMPEFGLDSRWTVRLSTPRPSIVIGYNPRVFTSHYVELQQGIIADPRGEPRDLGRISESIEGMYWPFFVVDVNEKSMVAARNGCAGATATCNNALMILGGAMINPEASHYDQDFITSLSTAVHSFSLSVSGRSASLMTHNSEGSVAEAVGIVRSYELDQAADLEALARRIRTILIWGQKTRLQAIMDLLDRLDQRVNFKEHATDQETVSKLPLELPDPSMGDAKKKKSKKDVLETVLAGSMPSWSRVEV